MNSELATLDRQLVRNIDDVARVSKLLADSGYFADARDAAQAGVKVLAGHEMGIGPFAAMAGIHVIKGKPTIGAGLMASAVKRSNKYDYRVLEHSRETCRIQFLQHGEPIGVSEFTLEDAKAAGLLGNDSWKKAPRNMLFARALSNGVRWYAPDVFYVSTYVPEEMGAEVDDEGNLIRIEPMPTSPAPQPATTSKPSATKNPPSPTTESIQEAEIVELVTPQQLKEIGAIVKRHGITDPKDARGIFGAILQRDIQTSRDLTAIEANRIIHLTEDEWDEAIVAHASEMGS